LAADRTARATMFAERGDTALALSAYAEALQLDDTYGPAWLGFGRVREALGDATQAELAYTRATEALETRALAFEARGQLRARAGKNDLALGDFQAAAEAEPNAARLFELGKRFAERRAWSAALAAYRGALAMLAPDSDEATKAGVEIAALRILAAETDVVSSGAQKRGWVRRALAAIALRQARSKTRSAQGARKLAP
jgi:tetratricopeptide (TPR) repeat protein